MIMGWIYTGIIVISILFAVLGGHPMGAAVTDGAQKGITLALSIGGIIYESVVIISSVIGLYRYHDARVKRSCVSCLHEKT